MEYVVGFCIGRGGATPADRLANCAMIAPCVPRCLYYKTEWRKEKGLLAISYKLLASGDVGGWFLLVIIQVETL